MSEERCATMQLLIQADLDGELDASQAATLAVHLATCRDCTTKRDLMAKLASRLRTEASRYSAPDSLREAVMTRVAAATPIVAPVPARAAGPTPPSWFGGGYIRVKQAISFGAGFALAASLAMMVVLPQRGDRAGEIIADHIRALQPGHLTDVLSTDQHTVKPWFNGRLDYSPPVKNLAAAAFPLVGGRLDYMDNRPVAALVYHRAQHVIDLYVWPVHRSADHTPSRGQRSGYHYIRWTDGEMVFWAVSDLNAVELGQFVDLWRSTP